MINPRQLAFEALIKIEKEGAYSNIALDSLLSKTDCDTRDRAFVSNLFYGVIERKITLDYQISCYTDKSKKMKPELLAVLRIGAYQLLYMDKVPSSAAVNESVKLAKKNGLSFASGLVNAVLRKIDNTGLNLPSDENYSDYLSIKYSCPTWLINKWIKEYGCENTQKILEHSLGANKNYIRVNNVKTTEAELIEKLGEEGVIARKTDIENCLEISFSAKSVEKLEAFKQGLFHVQDLSCQLCIKALAAQKGNRVFDLCAAPGGKTYTIAEEIENCGEVLSFDIHPHRVSLIESGANRLGLSAIKALEGDATFYNEYLGTADAVLCDVPCSGFGIIGKKPEIKYKDPDEAKQLPALQLEIIKNGAKYVKPGGRLVYSTCTLARNENEKVCEKFLADASDFKPVCISGNNDTPYKTILPHEYDSDGFFIACFERKI